MQYINHNGKLLPAIEPVLMVNNRSFRYGDGVFETIRFANNKPQFLAEHLQRIHEAMEVLKMNVNSFIDHTNIYEQIIALAEKNKVGTDARVRFTIYRNEGGLYTPESNDVSYVIEIEALEEQNYVLNLRGYNIDVYTEFKKQKNALSALKSANSSIYVMAGIFKKMHQFDECLILNDNHSIIEAISSNFFAVKNGVLYTPPVNDGCVNGIMRKIIIEIARSNRIAVHEISVMQSVLLGADELFLTNAVNGIRWIVAYKQKRYFNATSKKLIDSLNKLIV
ncbi:MAG: aminotransferase class IV [Bacteroidia bacterium]